jgi:hypothetical protein
MSSLNTTLVAISIGTWTQRSDNHHATLFVALGSRRHRSACAMSVDFLPPSPFIPEGHYG